MMEGLCVYGIIAGHETERMQLLANVLETFPHGDVVNAIFPALRKVPWQNRLLAQGEFRCGRRLAIGELGCVLSHRNAWKRFLNSTFDRVLILESDSRIPDAGKVVRAIEEYGEQYDILFLGSYHGRTKLRRSTAHQVEPHRFIGVPLPNTLYCAYGYVLTREAARFLLKRTAKVAWPVDYWSKWLRSENGDYLMRVGAVVPEIISSWPVSSSIQDHAAVRANESFLRRLRYVLIELYNSIKGFFS
jgi:GR25 family glycosyltransferase involved in LPS biosynthesis